MEKINKYPAKQIPRCFQCRTPLVKATFRYPQNTNPEYMECCSGCDNLPQVCTCSECHSCKKPVEDCICKTDPCKPIKNRICPKCGAGIFRGMDGRIKCKGCNNGIENCVCPTNRTIMYSDKKESEK